HARALASQFARASDLANDLANALTLANDLTSYRALASDRDLASDRASGLVRVIDRAAERANNLCKELRSLEAATIDAVASGKRQANPMRAAGRIAQTTTLVLPVADRARYCDEFRSELHDLAATGVSRLGQLVYAVRLMDQAWTLRTELRVSAVRR